MSITSFLIGLSLGLVFHFWKQYQLNNQLRKILSTFSQFESVESLSIVSLVRRSINLFNKEYNLLASELETNKYLLENAPIGYLKIDKENQLLWCNKEARFLLKIERWQSNQLRLFLELIISFELDKLIQEVREKQEYLTLEWEFYPNENYNNEEKNSNQKNKYPLFLKAYGYPLNDQGVAIFIKNKQQIKLLKESRNRIFSDLSHELRTPLTSILLLIEILLRKTENQEKKWVEKINQQVNRLIELIEKWLDISELEANPYQNLEYQKLNIKQLIITAWESIENLGEEKNINFQYSGEETLSFHADFNRLTQVFVNLFDNAIKNNVNNGTIQVIVTEKESNLVEINIIDSGKGFLKEDLPYIFERLYRGDKSRMRKEGDNIGSGLGLAIVKEIILAHNGQIIAQNDPQTGGGWIQIILPKSSPTSS